MGVDVSVRELEQSTTSHENAAKKLAEISQTNQSRLDSSALLLFYATECALKSAILRRGKLQGTADLEEFKSSHNLRAMCKKLSMAQSDIPKELFSSKTGNIKVSHTDLHQAWRYGKLLNNEEMLNAFASLETVLNWYRGEKGSRR